MLLFYLALLPLLYTSLSRLGGGKVDYWNRMDRDDAFEAYKLLEDKEEKSATFDNLYKDHKGEIYLIFWAFLVLSISLFTSDWPAFIGMLVLGYVVKAKYSYAASVFLNGVHTATYLFLILNYAHLGYNLHDLLISLF